MWVALYSLIFLCRSPDLAKDDTLASEFAPEKDIGGRHFLFDKKCESRRKGFAKKGWDWIFHIFILGIKRFKREFTLNLKPVPEMWHAIQQMAPLSNKVVRHKGDLNWNVNIQGRRCSHIENDMSPILILLREGRGGGGFPPLNQIETLLKINKYIIKNK